MSGHYDEEEDSRKDWRIDKKIPIGIVFIIMVQSAAAVWWASGITSKVDSLTVSISSLEAESADENLRQWARINRNEDLITDANGAIRTNKAILERIERDLSRLIDLLSENLSDGPN